MPFNPILGLTGRAVGWEKRDRSGEGGGRKEEYLIFCI